MLLLQYTVVHGTSGKDINNLIKAGKDELPILSEQITDNKSKISGYKSYYIFRYNFGKISFRLLRTQCWYTTKKYILGAAIDETLNWKDYIFYIRSKVDRQCDILYHTRESLSNQLYLTYCNTVWSAVCQSYGQSLSSRIVPREPFL